MTGRQSIPNPVLWESTTATLTVQLTDARSLPLPLSSIHTVQLKLYDLATGTILNSRDDVDIKNANGGTIDAGGALALELSDDDNALLNQEVGIEWHIALLTWTWANGAKTGRKEVAFQVANQAKVT